jgi:transcriptional regulator with XRE-family HTH domain
MNLSQHDSNTTALTPRKNFTGHTIKSARKKAGLSQTELCQRLAEHGVILDRTALSRIESGVRAVYDYELAALFQILGEEFMTEAVVAIRFGERD